MGISEHFLAMSVTGEVRNSYTNTSIGKYQRQAKLTSKFQTLGPQQCKLLRAFLDFCGFAPALQQGERQSSQGRSLFYCQGGGCWIVSLAKWLTKQGQAKNSKCEFPAFETQHCV